jgi:outer membrane immunogenic protein
MRRLSIMGMAAASAIAFSQIASAADLPLKAPVYVPPAYSWAGFYVGANIGGGWGDRNVDYAINDLGSLSLFRNLGGAPSPVAIST